MTDQPNPIPPVPESASIRYELDRVQGAATNVVGAAALVNDLLLQTIDCPPDEIPARMPDLVKRAEVVMRSVISANAALIDAVQALRRRDLAIVAAVTDGKPSPN